MKLSCLFLFLLFSQLLIAQPRDTITTKSGLKYFITHRSGAPPVDSGIVIFQHYTLWLSNGDKVQSSRDGGEPFVYEHPSNDVIKGSNELLALMGVGDRGIFIMPPYLAYGEKGKPPTIPPNETLTFDIEIMSTMKSSVRMELMKTLYGTSFAKDSIPKVKEMLMHYDKLQQGGFAGVYSRGADELIFIGNDLKDKYPKEAIEVFKRSVLEQPDTSQPFRLLGETYLKIGDKAYAIENFTKAVQLHPGDEKSLSALNELGENTAALVKHVVVEEAVLSSYVGNYELIPGFVITVVKEGNQLKVQATGQGQAEIYPISKNVFYFKVAEAQIAFNVNDLGQVESMTIFQHGKETVGKKLPD